MEKRSAKKGEIEKGMQLAARLPDIMPDQASEQIKPIYKDIQYTLRVPVVNLIFRTLANFPTYFEPVWKELSPVFRTKAFETQANNLREKALLEEIPDSSGLHWGRLAEMDRLRPFNDTIHYVLPKLLLITTLFDEQSFGSRNQQEADEQEGNSEIKLGVAEGTGKVEMVNPEKAPEQVQGLFSSIKEKHAHPLVSSYYRGLANWPAFLEEAWKRIKPVVGSSAYEARKQTLINEALAGLKHLPVPEIKAVELKENQAEEIRLILAAFQHKFIPEMMLDVALIKAMLDGAEAALHSRFSVA